MFDDPILDPMSQRDAAVNAERLVNEARHAVKQFGVASPEVDVILREAQIYATLSNRPYVP
jgi:hypothetical protein